MLHQPTYLEMVAERFGPDDFRDPALRTLYGRIAAAGSERSMEELASGLDDETSGVLELLLEEEGGLEDAERIVRGCLTALQADRVTDALREIDRQLPLASGAEQDELMLRKKQLTDEWRSLGGRGWKSFDRSRQ